MLFRSPDQVYSVEFRVEDVADSAFDSGVFIGGLISRDGTTPSQSFVPENPVVANPASPPAWVFEPTPVVPGQVTWWDPWVANGYLYSVDNPSGPLFATFQAPDLGFDNQFELYGCPTSACSAANDYSLKLADILAGVT